ncbi:glycosyltransferase family 2 protein [Aeromicrobium sp.]|uniref:glycosyltransferase family 2 protein n=1 Tax=Aeromicrobium sp. TaxID=1871063 RepID=UPI0025C3A6FA|nr:glycosyltransferase family 2 protein [Aeromicrobium sp.]
MAIIVVNYGSSTLLARNLVAVANELPEAHVVVVDNLSSNPERHLVRGLCDAHGWTGIYPNGNTGFGGGCNLGVDQALARGARTILLLNPDAVIDRASTLLLVAAASAGDAMTLAAPRVVRPDGSHWSAGSDLDLDRGDMRSWRRRHEAPDARTLPWLSGACLVLDAELWRRVGGFDEDYFLYWEDVDLSVKVTEAGGKLELVDGATAVHDEGRTHDDGHRAEAKSSIYYYYNIRNRLLFATKHLDEADRRRWRRTAADAAWQIIRRGGRRQLVRPGGFVGAAWRGTRDGIRGTTGPWHP